MSRKQKEEQNPMIEVLRKIITATLEKYGEEEGGELLANLYNMMEGLKDG